MHRIKPQYFRLCQHNPTSLSLSRISYKSKENTFQIQKRDFSFQSTIESLARTQTGLFKSLSESTPVEYCQKLLLTVHDTTGLPWWATIICTTIMLRTVVTVPLAIYQNLIMAKLENLKMEMDEIAVELKKETSLAVKIYNWDEQTARSAFKRSIKKQWNQLIIRDNCHPFKTSLLFWFQIPLWVSVSVSLRNLVYMLPGRDITAQLTYSELSVGGFGWIPNLIEVDSSLILPVSFGLINLAIIELQTLSKVTVPTKFQRYLTNFFRGITVIMIPIAASVPSCLVLYWTTSSAYGLAQNLILLSPKIKRSLKIPPTPSELDKPYKHIVLGMKHKLQSMPLLSKN